MNHAETIANAPARAGAGSAGLWVSLLVVATAQLMIVLDDTIANIALSSIQRDLSVSAGILPWIINAYVLVFGALLLFGGRVGDLYGRRRVLRIGLAVFSLASLLGGLGVNAEMLITSRALQGVGAAMIAPNVLALIATNFPAGKERNRAMAVYAAMSAVGMTVGILLGGLLTGMLSWRWVFFINVPIGAAVLLGTRALMEGQPNKGRMSVIEALTGTGALIALTYGITRGGDHGWADPGTLASFAIAVLLGAIFLWLQSRSEQPMLPLGLFRDRNRTGSYVGVVFIGGGLMATFYLLTLFMQQVLQFSPVMAGLASLPVSVGIVLSAGISTKLVERFAPRFVAAPGLLIASAGLFWLSTLAPGSSYVWHVLPALFFTYFGLGMGFMPLTLTAVQGVPEDEAGVASAMLNTSQQIGAALGVAVQATVSTAIANRLLPEAASVLGEGLASGNLGGLEAATAALTQGYTSGFLAGGGLLIIAAAAVFFTVTTKRTHTTSEAGVGL
jgi:EmrB/QacA subfamily drug resistance transporter